MRRAFQWDLARQVERLDFLLKWLPRYADWGYEELYLHLEDAVEFPSLPGVARRDAYSQKQFARLVEAATRAGLRVVPIVNLLGHTQYLIKTPVRRDLNELRDEHDRPLDHGQVCPLHPRLLEVAEKLLHDMAPFCTAGLVHAGLDESFHLGRCPRCRAEIGRIGLAAHFAGHVSRLHAIAGGLGLRLGLWADMFYYIPEAIASLPRDVTAYEWYYYPFAHRPRVELFNFAEADLASRFRKCGIEFYGCPMNGAFRWEPLPAFRERMENILSWWRHCRRTGAAGFLVTSWEPGRLAIELTTAIDAAAAGLWADPEIRTPEKMLECGFARVFGHAGKSAAHAALAADKFPFSGYARWQINDRWDVFATREPVAGHEREARTFRALAKTPGLPPAPAASLRFRHYLAQRDLFVRHAAQAVFTARRHLARGKPAKAAAVLAQSEREAKQFAEALKRGLAAARVMWRRSRDRHVRGPNEDMLRRDARRLRAWRAWLRRAKKNPVLVRGATPVGGPWQLQFTLHNFAPALQKIVVEQRRNGAWEALHGLFTIEFKAAVARPRAGLVREISVPVDSPGTALRLAVRGVGQVAVSEIVLTDGVARRRPRGPRGKIILGRPAPRAGFPAIDWTHNNGELILNFA
ncbi:MAG TPA: family 20 glycosylhydrolase [Opitutaceae bacterium]|nr:family 20 glycosylhydrolase [Opitutaceae bacterium]